jgi:SAM-dependent methyltransferase
MESSVSPWYERLFDERYLAFYDEVLSRGMAVADADFAEAALALRPSSRILDLGCGVGRHAVPLARLGHRVTGIDLSETMLALARALAVEQKVEVDFARRDMRELAGLGPFDACVCLYTVLGYFDDANNAQVLHSVAKILVDGGKLLLDVSNPLALMPSWPGQSWRESRCGIAREISRYDPRTARLTAQRSLFGRDGARHDLPPSDVRMYAPHEVAALLVAAGFEVEQLHGDLRGQPFDWKRSVKQVWVARRA